MGASDRYAYSRLDGHRAWLGAMPVFAHADHGVLTCHGTPDERQSVSSVEEVLEGYVGWCEHVRATIENRLGDVQARVVLCGHSHQQHLIQLPRGPLILNPGSVGCPYYDDPDAEPHVSGSKLASREGALF